MKLNFFMINRHSVFLLLIACGTVQAQDSLSLTPDSFSKILAEKLSQTRILDIEYGSLSGFGFDAKYIGQNLGERRVELKQNIRANINIPLLQRKKWRLTFSQLYHFQNSRIENSDREDNQFNYFKSAVSFTYFSSLFKKPIIYNASLIADADEEKFGRLQGLVTALVVLKRDAKQNLNVGLAGVVDPTSQIPVLPIVTYTRNIFNDKWRLDAVLPSRVMLQTQLVKNGRLSLGTQLETSNFYIHTSELVDYAYDFEIRQTGLKSGLIYEQLINNKIVLTGKGGYMNVFRSGIAEKGEVFKKNNFIIEFDQKGAFYFNLGISFNPF